MIQTTEQDVVFSGHGAVLPAEGIVTRVPSGVEFYTFGPPGTTITDHLGQMLEGGLPIRNLFIISPKTNQRSPLQPSVYTDKSGSIPNLLLESPRKLDIGGKGVVPHIIGVEKVTSLHDLWQRLKPFIKSGKTLRVFWGACSYITQDDPEVDAE